VTGTAATRKQEKLMPYLVPPRTPLTPEQVDRAFAYLMALEAGGGAGVAGRADADPDLPFLLLWLTEDLVLPVTTVPDDEDPTADPFVLEQTRGVLLSALRDWQSDSPTTGCIGLAGGACGSSRTFWPTRTTAATSPPPWNGCETSAPRWPRPQAEAPGAPNAASSAGGRLGGLGMSEELSDGHRAKIDRGGRESEAQFCGVMT
jgi:hypothetical protein